MDINRKLSPIQERNETTITSHASKVSEVSKVSENTKKVEDHNMMLLFGDDDSAPEFNGKNSKWL